MGNVGKYGAAAGGFVLSLALASTPFSPGAVAAAGSVAANSMSAGKIGESISEKVNSILHDEKRENYANKLWYFIKLYKEDRITLRKILTSSALNIFRSFEQQFVNVNNNKKWRRGMIDLAKDGVHRSINYSVEHYKPTSLTFEAIVSIGVIEGKSKNRLPHTKPELIYEHEKSEIVWTSSSLYRKAGIAIEDGEKYSYYEKNDQSNKAHKYGYRLLLHAEDWNEISKDYRLSQVKENRFQNYKYRFKTLNIEERKQVSNKINSDNDILTKGNLKEIIEEVKHSLLNEINQSLESYISNEDDSKIIQEIASNIAGINVEEFEAKYLEHLNEIKNSLQEMSQKEEQHYKENTASHQKTYVKLEDMSQREEQHHSESVALQLKTQAMVQSMIYDGEKSENDQPILFDISPPINMFTRKTELNSLTEIMQKARNKNITKTVIWGLGGIGKTQLARQYIKKSGQKIYENIIWINSENETRMNDSFIRLAKILQLKIPEEEIDQIKIILNEVYEILCKRNTLFIFDNAEKSKTFMKMLPKNVYSFEKKIHILITSRDREWGINISDMHLEELSLEDGMHLVKKGLKIEDDSQNDNIKILLDKLQNFPLCLNQAISYIRERQLSGKFTIKSYLNKLEKFPRNLFDSDSFKEYDNDPYAKTAYTTWMITINKIRIDSLVGDLAVEIFHIMSYLAPQNIKRKNFRVISKNVTDLEKATRLLAKYSMIDIIETNYGTEELVEEDTSTEEEESDETCFQIHRTVQHVTRLHLKENNAEGEVIVNTYKVLKEYLKIIQTVVINFDRVREGLPHFETFLKHIKCRVVSENPGEKDIEMYDYVVCFLDVSNSHFGNSKIMKKILEESVPIYQKCYGPDHYQVARLLIRLSNTYESLGEGEKQKELLEKALNIFEKYHNSDHYEIGIILVNLGNAYSHLGDVAKQKEYLEKALNIFEKSYGPDHYEVAKILVSLSSAHGSLGHTGKQKALLEGALNIEEKHYGSNHYEIASTLTNLGHVYQCLGEVQKGKEALEKALNISENHYGPEHYEVAIILTNLGNIYVSLGDVGKTKELLEKALNIFEKHYGPNHYVVARILTNLSNVHGVLGDVQKQEELLEKALNISEKHYGPNHFEVARILGSLGSTYGSLGDNQKAKKLLEKALNIKEQHYGTNHYEVAITLGNLSNIYGSLGDIKKQKELSEKALDIYEKHYGPDHYELAIILEKVAIIFGNIGQTYGSLGHLRKQKDLLKKALNIYEKQFGPNHYRVVKVLISLGDAYRSLGDVRKHKELLERALNISENQYDPDHFEVAKILGSLGGAYESSGDILKQKELLEKALNIFKKHYGSDHYQVVRILTNLSFAYGSLGDIRKQKELLKKALNVSKKHHGPNHYEVASISAHLGLIYGYLGDVEKEKELLKKASKILEKYDSSHHCNTDTIFENFSHSYGSLVSVEEEKELVKKFLNTEKHYDPAQITDNSSTVASPYVFLVILVTSYIFWLMYVGFDY